MFKNALHPLLHLFIPHHCAGCGSDIIGRQQVLCMHCINRLPVTGFHHHADNPIEKIFWGRMPIDAASSYLYFSKDSLLQHIVHELKYKGNKELGLFIGRKMGEALLQTQRFQQIDALVPLPLFTARQRKRGYNQASLLCRGMAAVLSLPVLEQIIRRHTSSDTQTNKNRIDRWLNMQHKFELQQPDAISGKHILLVDDVITTGATLEACGQQLLTVPSTRLSIMTMAFTVK
ncbi:phosphoribosyltransferase [Niastella yeongjuensis]|uniref:Phosphoribosyltransferase n=1 Tax=Niastella yeongjuensis TaxID=354355 RepID=A0A1V9EN30_9BACT|nr:phosphoribosyltransferase family protein [Niastella yeongjuensis]OQP47536.1 phosphoribosyltransferase [Niastella yeongjuensis]SEN63891.1 comF family protein [Niastella yeongjuensis]